MSALRVRHEKVALSSECKPNRQLLQPETAGAVLEVTKMAEAFGVAGHE
jgi:hypothetical protein